MNRAAINLIRWSARSAGILILVAFILLFAGGKESAGGSDLHLLRSIMPLRWMATFAFYFLGWKWERIAGVMIVLLYLMHGLIEPESFFAPLWIVMALPGLMYLLCSIEWDVESETTTM